MENMEPKINNRNTTVSIYLAVERRRANALGNGMNAVTYAFVCTCHHTFARRTYAGVSEQEWKTPKMGEYTQRTHIDEAH